MDLFDYDYEELARRVQSRLDRLTVDYLRAHGARIRKDVLDFHDREHIDLEVAHGPHLLKVRQIGPSTGLDPTSAPPLEIFESTVDGAPARQAPLEALSEWLASLPKGTAEAEPARDEPARDNPFLAERPTERKPQPASKQANPFLSDSRPREESNPFTDPDADERRRKARQWLGSDQ